MIGRMYVNSLLVTLNARASLRQNLADHSSLVPDCGTLGVNVSSSIPPFHAATRDWRLETLPSGRDGGEESFVPATKAKADVSLAMADDVSSIKYGREVWLYFLYN
jgi:hypothetical protein